MRIRQLAHVCLFAHDLDETEAFYRDALGLPVKFRFLRGGQRVGFYLDLGGRTNIEVFARSDARFAETDAINHLCLEVEDMDAARAHLASAGVAVTDRKLGCDGTWQAWLTDPNGVKIELFQYTAESAQFTGGDRSLD